MAPRRGADRRGHTAVSNVHKAAVLLMSLPEEDAARVLAKLKPKQVEAVSIEIAQVSNVRTDEQEQVIVEFADMNPKSLGGVGGLELAQNLVQRALGRDATTTLENLRQSIESVPFGFLKKVDPQNILTFLVDEHPQTIALILCHVPPPFGAEILSGLPPSTQFAVIRRIAHMGQTSPEVIQQVEDALEYRMQNVMSQSLERAGGVATVAEILNVADRATERALLDNLGQDDPDLVEEIRRLMFVFDDIGKLTDKDVQQVLKHVETGQWAMALKGASETLRQKILGNMSQRASATLLEEMEFLGPKRLAEVESVQQQIVDIVRRLEETGDITVQSAEEKDEFVS
ncbi:MAG: flagellar motor switch protein FliG [Planctomycetes bacterium]|nr:flagellar motor switch protein FliG [Planctomycetota bacterium]